MVGIAVLIALLLGGGTSLAAEGATPGSALYPVKVGLNEQVRGVLAFTDEAEAEWSARLFERRLEEAEQLAARARISAEARAEIESRLDVHAQAFEQNVQELKAQGDLNTALEARSGLESKLKAHVQVLSNILERVPDARREGDPILSKVQSRITASAQARAEAESDLVAHGGPAVERAADGKRKAAENKIAEVRRFLDRMRTSVEANVLVNAEGRMSAADAAFVRGDAHLEAAAYAEAFISYEEAMRIAQEAQVLVATSDRIRVDAAGMLDVRGGEKDDAPDTEDETDASLEAETDVEAGTGTSNAKGRGRLQVNLGL